MDDDWAVSFFLFVLTYSIAQACTLVNDYCEGTWKWLLMNAMMVVGEWS